MQRMAIKTVEQKFKLESWKNRNFTYCYVSYFNNYQ